MPDNSQLDQSTDPSLRSTKVGVAPANQAPLDTLLEEAKLHARSGDWDAVISACRGVLAHTPDSIQAHSLMASVMLPGEPYLALMRRIHAHLRPRTYVEVGVANGDSLTLVGEGTLALGIDPAPQIAHPLLPSTKVFSMTSDDFFARHNLNAELGGLPVDLAFIDGMHHFEFALRDFMHLERHGTPGSTILIHDCYPLDEATAARNRTTAFWSGDIWKLTLCLKEYRPELAVYTIATPPTGLGVVRNLDSHSTVLRDNFRRICDEFIPLSYDTIAGEKPQLLNLFPNVWPQVRALFE
jgi:hypothetical protein